MRGIPRALGCIAYLSVWREVGALCGAFSGFLFFIFIIFFIFLFIYLFFFFYLFYLFLFIFYFLFFSLPTLCFPLCISVTGAHSSRGRGGSWLGCQVLPAIGAVSILELAANSGSSRMFRAPNLQRATMLFSKNLIKVILRLGFFSLHILKLLGS